MKIYLGADHGGFELKEKVKTWLSEKGYEFEDYGPFSYDEKDDYPDFAFPVAEKVAEDSSGESLGILACRSSAGVVIAANKVKGIRAAGPRDLVSTKHAREHNNINILGLSGDWVKSDAEAKEMVFAFLETPFSNDERHVRRLAKITAYESSH